MVGDGKMNLKKFAASTILAVIVVAGIASAIITVIPDSSAYKISALGYKSHCPFAPYSTIISIAIALVALIVFLIAKRFVWR